MGSFAQGALITQLASTATSGSTTTLTASSNSWQRFTGTSAQTIVLPDSTTMKIGRSFIIANRSTGILTVNYNGGTLAAYVASGSQREFSLYGNGSTAGDWSVSNQTDVDGPLAIHATRPTPDANLNISSNQLVNTDGSTTSTAPADDTLVTYSGVAIAFQTSSATGGTTGGTITTAGAAFTRPSVTVSYYVRMAMVYQSAANAIDTLFSAENVAQGSLTDAGVLFASMNGTPIGYIDLQSTGTGTYNFKSAGAATNVIKNDAIIKFGAGSGGGGAGGDSSFKIQSVAADGTTKIKGGYFVSEENKIYATYNNTTSIESSYGKDITIDLDSVMPTAVDSTTYYLYIDKTDPSATLVTDSNRYLYPISSAAPFRGFTLPFDSIDVSRYFPVGVVRRDVAAWTTLGITYPTKRQTSHRGLLDLSLQTNPALTTTSLVKRGYLKLSDGREIYVPSEFSVPTSAYSVDGDYYVYLDLYSLPAPTTVNGRSIITVNSDSYIKLFTTIPSAINLSRYLPLGTIQRISGVWQAPQTLAIKSYTLPVATNTSLEYSLPATTIGTVGSASQIAAGHVLVQNSFPSAAYAATSFYNLLGVTDGNTTLAHDLTNNGTTPFTGTGILGLASTCASLNGSTQYLNSLDVHFDAGDTDFTCGGWFNPTAWATGTQTLCSQWVSSGNFAFLLNVVSGTLTLTASSDGTTSTNTTYDVSTFTGWHHVSLKYVAATNTFTLWVDSIVVTTLILTSGLKAVGATRNFAIGKKVSGTDWLTGLVDEFFFCNGTAYSDDDISKIYSAKFSHNRSLGADQQDWKINATFGGIDRDIESDVIVDKDASDLYVDFSSLPATATVSMKMNARGSAGTAMAASARMFEGTATELDTAIGGAGSGINFGFPSMITACSLFAESGTANRFEPVSDTTAYFLFESVSPYRLMFGGTTLATGLGSGATKVKLVVSTGSQSVAISRDIWNTSVVTTDTTISHMSQIFANPTGTLNLTLPSAPRLGDTVRVIDFDGTWSVTDKVMVLRNGNKIAGLTADLQLNVPSDRVTLVFNGTYDWRLV